jgi:predicted RNase H-like HicB family nuclease
MIYDVYLQVKRTGCTHAHVPALPGCNWLASSPDAAWEQATAAIQDHLDWLRRYVRQAAPLDEPVLPQLAQQNNNPQSIPIQPASRSVWKRSERMQVLSFEKLLHYPKSSGLRLWSTRAANAGRRAKYSGVISSTSASTPTTFKRLPVNIRQ